MDFIKDLGIRVTNYIDKRYNKPQTVRYGLFKCPVCNQEIEVSMKRGFDQNTCKPCRGTQNITHGHSGKKYYQTWLGMLQRCNNSNNKKYPIYGGKGITVDPAWIKFEKFWEDMGNAYSDGLTIDRIDSNKGYFKDNCRWISLSQNSSETTKRIPVNQYRMVYTPTKSWVLEKTWESAKQAADELNLVAAHISVVCSGKRKSHGGFKWEYFNEVPIQGEVNE